MKWTVRHTDSEWEVCDPIGFAVFASACWEAAYALAIALATSPAERHVFAVIWEQGRASVAEDFLKPMGENGMRPVSPNPYKETK